MPRFTMIWAGLASAGLLSIMASAGFSEVPSVSPNPSNALQTAWTRWSASPNLTHSSVSAEAYDITTGKVLAEIHPNQRETPASVTKLFTSAAALAQLGPNFRYKTVVEANPAHDTAPGPIYLVGGGDPWLEADGAEDLENLATQVSKRVTKATRVVGVASLFTQPLYGMGWPYGDISQNYAAGTAALMAERSEVFVTVTQGQDPGHVPIVRLSFNGEISLPSYFDVVNQARTGSLASSDTISVTRQIGTNEIVVRGNIPVSGTDMPTAVGPFVLSVGNPARFAAQLFEKALKADGVAFSAPAALAAAAPADGIVLADHDSAPLSNDLQIQNQYSINQMAENLYRELGVHAAGVGSLAASASAMKEFSSQAGISSDRVQVDGSGLSPLDETSAQELVQLLAYASKQSWYQAFRTSLMHLNDVAACGILCPSAWTYNLPAKTAIWVKTGNLTNQWNYAGYARAVNGNLIAFAILDDGSPTTDNAFRGSPVDEMMEDTAFWPAVPAAPVESGDQTSDAAQGAWANLVSGLVPAQAGSIVGYCVVDTATQKVVAAKDGNTLMSSGLLPRLFLAEAGLEDGPRRLADVTVSATATPESGRLLGNLVIAGNQDSALTSADLTAMADHIKAEGISVVQGNLDYVNGVTGFDASRWPSGMPWNDFGQAWTPPQSSLMVNQDQAALQVTANAPGKPPTIMVEPADTPISVTNEALTSPTGTESLHATLTFATNRYTVTGSIPKGTSRTLAIAPPDPGRYAAQQFLSALTSAGVRVTGSVQPVATAPPSRVVASLSGPSMADMVRQMLSNANIAPAESVQSVLGASLWTDVGHALDGQLSYIVEPTGAALGNYLTPNSVARMLANLWNQPSGAPVTSAWSASLWKTSSPEQYAVAGYIKGPNGVEYAITVMVSELLWNHHFTASVLS